MEIQEHLLERVTGFMKFDDGVLEISSSAFILGKVGDGGQFISGSNGNVEISSSNFHLSASGDVVMAGEAQSGDCWIYYRNRKTNSW